MPVRAHVTRVDVDIEGDWKLREIRGLVRDDVTAAVEADAKRHCPVDTGDLLLTIGSDKSEGAVPAATSGGMWAHQSASVGRVKVGTQYWDMPEYGGIEGAHTAGPYPPTVRKTDRHSTMDAEPYMRPAIYQPRQLRRYD